jgi:protocatechuate 3,4-dioxygenase beta subunit
MRVRLLPASLPLAILLTGATFPADDPHRPIADPAGFAVPETAAAHLRDAVDRIRDGRSGAALGSIAQAFAAEYPRPYDVLSRVEFRPLRDDPETRPVVRELVEKYARNASITMVDGEEPGTPLVLELTVMDAANGRPAEGVIVRVVHADAGGLYQPGDADAGEAVDAGDAAADGNPRLFGSAVTDAAGRVRIRTIRPAHDADRYGPEAPAHVHFTVVQGGADPRTGEILFDDDERLTDARREEARRDGTLIVKPVADADGTLRAEAKVWNGSGC